MEKFCEISILVRRKLFSAFYPILLFLIAMVSLLWRNLILSILSPSALWYDRKHFCSIFTDLSNLSFFSSKVPFAKNVLTKQFSKMKKQPFTDVLQNRCSYKFPDIQKKIPALKSLFHKVKDLKACNFNKKRDKRFSVNITKFLRTVFLWHHLQLKNF